MEYTLYPLCSENMNQSIIDRIWGKWAWLQQEFYGVTPNGTDTASPEDADDAQKLIAIVALEEELDDFQPLYRNPLLQRLYALDSDCSLSDDDDSMYRFGFTFFWCFRVFCVSEHL